MDVISMDDILEPIADTPAAAPAVEAPAPAEEKPAPAVEAPAPAPAEEKPAPKPRRRAVSTGLSLSGLAQEEGRQAAKDTDSKAAELIPDDFSVEGEFEAREQKRRLAEAVDSLGEPDREIIVRKFFLRQPSKLIAERLGLTAANVDTRTHRAVRKLRELLGGNRNE